MLLHSQPWRSPGCEASSAPPPPSRGRVSKRAEIWGRLHLGGSVPHSSSNTRLKFADPEREGPGVTPGSRCRARWLGAVLHGAPRPAGPRSAGRQGTPRGALSGPRRAGAQGPSPALLGGRLGPGPSPRAGAVRGRGAAAVAGPRPSTCRRARGAAAANGGGAGRDVSAPLEKARSLARRPGCRRGLAATAQPRTAPRRPAPLRARLPPPLLPPLPHCNPPPHPPPPAGSRPGPRRLKERGGPPSARPTWCPSKSLPPSPRLSPFPMSSGGLGEERGTEQTLPLSRRRCQPSGP